MDEVEEKLALDTAPVTWPIGRGKTLLEHLISPRSTVRQKDEQLEPLKVNGPESEHVAGLCQRTSKRPSSKKQCWHRRPAAHLNYSLLDGALTPVFFGSALRNFGVRDLIHALRDYAPAPRDQESDRRMVTATEPDMSAFVFKIQANMDPNHRDPHCICAYLFR